MSKLLLRNLENKIIDLVPKSRFCAYSNEKSYLNSLNQYVPKEVHWTKFWNGKLSCQVKATCWASAVKNNLKWYSKLVGKTLDLPIKELREGDHRCDAKTGGNPIYALQYSMMNGVLRPRSEHDPYPSFGDKVPISGYFKVPDTEEMLVRATAQQPVLVSLWTGEGLDDYTGGIYEGDCTDSARMLHTMNCVGYTDDYFILVNNYGRDWGEDGCMRVRRGMGEIDGLYRRMYIPFLSVDDHWTDFNSELMHNNMSFEDEDLGCFCPRDLKHVRNNMHNYPEEYLRKYGVIGKRGLTPRAILQENSN
ncbi:Mexicain [Bienertia sinuspersici]